jgi:hypothetical protein
MRLSESPRPTPNTSWKCGKGVIGSCWRNAATIGACTESLWKPYIGCSRATWRQAPASVQMNLTYREFRAISGKYVGAIATPILDRAGRFRGCVCVDARAGVNWEDLSSPEVYVILEDMSATIGNYLSLASRKHLALF